MEHTLQYLNLAMPPSRVVTGNFLDKLAGLKFAPHEFMPLTVHACIMAQATLPKEREHVGCAITEGVLKTLATSNKSIGLETNSILQRVFEVLEAHSAHGRDPRTYGDMAVECVKFMFGLDSNYENLGEISVAFVGQLLDPTSVASQPASSSLEQDVVGASLVEFGEHGGTNTAGRITAINKGFSVCEYIEKKKQTGPLKQFQISYINDDGSVGCFSVRADSTVDNNTVLVIPLKNLVQEYKQSREQIQLMKDYPKNSVDTCQESF